MNFDQVRAAVVRALQQALAQFRACDDMSTRFDEIREKLALTVRESDRSAVDGRDAAHAIEFERSPTNARTRSRSADAATESRDKLKRDDRRDEKVVRARFQQPLSFARIRADAEDSSHVAPLPQTVATFRSFLDRPFCTQRNGLESPEVAVDRFVRCRRQRDLKGRLESHGQSSALFLVAIDDENDARVPLHLGLPCELHGGRRREEEQAGKGHERRGAAHEVCSRVSNAHARRRCVQSPTLDATRSKRVR